MKTRCWWGGSGACAGGGTAVTVCAASRPAMARPIKIRLAVFMFHLLEVSDLLANKGRCLGRRSRTAPAAAGRVGPRAWYGGAGGPSARLGRHLGRRETPPQREALPHGAPGPLSLEDAAAMREPLPEPAPPPKPTSSKGGLRGRRRPRACPTIASAHCAAPRLAWHLPAAGRAVRRAAPGRHATLRPARGNPRIPRDAIRCAPSARPANRLRHTARYRFRTSNRS